MSPSQTALAPGQWRPATRHSPFLWLGLLAVVLLAAGCARMRRLGELTTPKDWREAMQPSLAEVERREIGAALTLGRAIRLAVERNPGIRAERQRWLAAIHGQPQATALRDPMLEFMYDDEKQSVRLGLRQEIPWWQKLWAMGKVAEVRSHIARLRYEFAVRDLIIEVKDAYYELYYLDQARAITEKIEAMLRNDALLAYAELNVGRTQLNEAFRAESQAAQLAYDRILLVEQRAAQAERLKALLNLPTTVTIGPVGHAPLYAVSPQMAPLSERAERYAEVLAIRGLEIQNASYETFLARLSRVPDLNVSFDVMRMLDPMGTRGRDFAMGGVGMNLPIWEQRNRALIHEKQAMEDAMRREALEAANRVRQAVADAYFQVCLTERLVVLYAGTLLPQAEAVMRQAEIYFRNDQASFSNLIETTLAYHNFLLAYHRAVADHGQAIGRLERVLGTTAEPRASDEVASGSGKQG